MTTARLVGRRPEPGDADAYVRFYGDPRTPEELWSSDLRTPDHARATLEEFIEHWQRWGFGVWTVLLPGGEVIGHAGVQLTTIGDRPEVELLWFSHPDYATELGGSRRRPVVGRRFARENRWLFRSAGSVLSDGVKKVPDRRRADSLCRLSARRACLPLAEPGTPRFSEVRSGSR